MTSDIHKIFGPPGTGKTTYLLALVEETLERGVPSKDIGYFSFTRKASHEARDRAILKFPHLNERTDFPYFRTLHSLAFHALPIKSENVLSASRMLEFAKEAGIEIRVSAQEGTGFAVGDNPVLNEIHLARIRGVDLRKHYDASDLDIEWHQFEYVERAYRHYKEVNQLVDFTDMLEMVVAAPEMLPQLDTVIIDEAQDLSKLQWVLVETLAKRCKHMHIAGDDDQCIFTWAGADVNSLLSVEGRITILDKSYRVPARVHTLANAIVKRVRNRQEKYWEPRDFEGHISTYSRVEDIPLDEGQWLFLASANYLLDPVHEWLKSIGVWFDRDGSPSLPPQIIQSVIDWEKLRRGMSVPCDSVRNMYRYLGPQYVARGHKMFKEGDPEALYSMDDLKSRHGLRQESPIWHEALEKIGDNRRDYIISILRRGTRLSKKPRIRLSTIHGAKGGEADNVVVLMDLSPKSVREYSHNTDAMYRLFYVAVTRTKQSLHLVLPKHAERGFIL